MHFELSSAKKLVVLLRPQSVHSMVPWIRVIIADDKFKSVVVHGNEISFDIVLCGHHGPRSAVGSRLSFWRCLTNENIFLLCIVQKKISLKITIYHFVITGGLALLSVKVCADTMMGIFASQLYVKDKHVEAERQINHHFTNEFSKVKLLYFVTDFTEIFYFIQRWFR